MGVGHRREEQREGMSKEEAEGGWLAEAEGETVDYGLFLIIEKVSNEM